MNKKRISIIGVLLILGIGGFIFLQRKSVAPVSPEIKKAQEEIMSNCKYDKDFCKYVTNGIVAMSSGYTITSESTYNGKKSKMIIKTDGKENSESVSYFDGKEMGSFISLNKTTYTKGPGETIWTEFPITKDETGKQSTNLFDFEGLKKELGNIKKGSEDSLVVKKVGTEACGKMFCTIFEMTEKITDSTTKMWVDTKEYRARKMEIDSKGGASIMMFDYGPVIITKPSPVRKMPPAPDLKDSGVDLNSEEIKNLMKSIQQANTSEIPEE